LREIAYELYKNIIALRPEWNEIREAEEGAQLTDKDKRELKPIERIKLVMTRGKDDRKNYGIYLALLMIEKNLTASLRTRNLILKSR
jgi:hypothetical protein